MSFRDFARSLKPGNDHALAAARYEDRESASNQAARRRRQAHQARVQRDGDAAGQPFPRRFFRNN